VAQVESGIIAEIVAIVNKKMSGFSVTSKSRHVQTSTASDNSLIGQRHFESMPASLSPFPTVVYRPAEGAGSPRPVGAFGWAVNESSASTSECYQAAKWRCPTKICRQVMGADRGFDWRSSD
jgi:hypothetical protein